MKIFTIVTLSIAMLALPVPAYAQSGRLTRPEEPKVNPDHKKADEKAYNDALSRSRPNQKEEFDPWQGVREKEPAEKPSVRQKKPAR